MKNKTSSPPSPGRTKYLIIYAVYVISFIFSLKNDLYSFNNSTSIDLLYRVVGARLMEDGKSPYFDKWQADQPNASRYYHPIPRYSQKINGVTVTPAILWLTTPFADQDFCASAKMWFYLQVAALFLCGLFLLISFRQLQQKIVALASFLFFFAFSRNFYLHLHSAQVYVIYGLIFCLLYLLLKSNLRNKYLLTGIVISLGIWLKPFFIFLLIPFLLDRNKSVLKGAAIVAAIFFIQVMVFHQSTFWKEYFSAMPEYARDNAISSRPDFLQIYPPPFGVSSCIYPMKNPDNLPLRSTGLASMQYYLMRLNITITAPWIFGSVALIAGLFISIVTRKRRSAEQLLALMFLLYLVAELCTPSLRFGYYLMQWPAAALVVLCSYKQNKFAAILMLAGLLINNGYFPFPHVYAGSVGEALMVIGLACFVIPIHSGLKTFYSRVKSEPNSP